MEDQVADFLKQLAAKLELVLLTWVPIANARQCGYPFERVRATFSCVPIPHQTTGRAW